MCLSESYTEVKMKLNVYFHASLRYLKRFYEGLLEAVYRFGRPKNEPKKSSSTLPKSFLFILFYLTLTSFHFTMK